MKDRDFERLSKTLKLNPGQAKRMREALQRAPVDLHVHLAPTGSLRGKAPAGAAAEPDAWIAARWQALDPETRQRLAAVEPRVLAWIDAGEENAALFARDPLAALRRAAPDLDPRAFAQLEKLRRENPDPPDKGGIALESVKLDARPPKDEPKKK